MAVDEIRAIQLERKLQTSRRLTWLSMEASRCGIQIDPSRTGITDVQFHLTARRAQPACLMLAELAVDVELFRDELRQCLPVGAEGGLSTTRTSTGALDVRPDP